MSIIEENNWKTINSYLDRFSADQTETWGDDMLLFHKYCHILSNYLIKDKTTKLNTSGTIEKETVSLQTILRHISDLKNQYLNKNKKGINNYALKLTETLKNWRPLYESKLTAARSLDDLASIILTQLVNDVCLKKCLGLSNNSPELYLDHVETFLPSRIDFYGGWLDTPPICFAIKDNSVINASILVDDELPIGVHIRLSKKPGLILIEEDGSEWSFSTNTIMEIYKKPNEKGCLLAACFVALNITSSSQLFSILQCDGLEFKLISRLPHGSGLGTSSIMAVAIISAINKLGILSHSNEVSYSEALSYTVLKVENLLTTGGGWQDQMGVIYNGVKENKLTNTGFLIQKPIKLSDSFRNEINQRLVLIYTGTTRLAKNLLDTVIKNYYCLDEAKTALDGLAIKEKQIEFRRKLENGIMPINLIEEYYEAKKIVANGCEPVIVKCLIENLKKEDIIETSWIAGAGGGGFLYTWLNKEKCIEDVDYFIRSNQQFKGMSCHSIKIVFDYIV